MIKLDIYTGLLGNGKTTVIRQMINTAYAGYKVAIIENEFGKVNLDAEFLSNEGITVEEISSGCICCTLKGNFTEAIKKLVVQEKPDYIIVEPTGMADASEVVTACLSSNYVTLNRIIMVVNARKLQKLLTIGGELFYKQFQNVLTVYMNFCEDMSSEEFIATKELIKKLNPNVDVIAEPIHRITKDTFQEISNSNSANLFVDSETMIKTHEHIKISSITPKVHSLKKERIFDNWYFEFHALFSENCIEKLLKIFENATCKDIWRVKGYLKMQNGKIVKLDYVFGDKFLEIIDQFAENKVNKLVIIGEKIPVQWLQQQFNLIESQCINIQM